MKALVLCSPFLTSHKEMEDRVKDTVVWAQQHGIECEVGLSGEVSAPQLAQNISLLSECDAVLFCGIYKHWKLTALYEQLAQYMDRIVLHYGSGEVV